MIKSSVMSFDERDVTPIDKEINKLGEYARSCINSELFQEYKSQVIESKLRLVDLIIAEIPDEGLEKYAISMIRYTERLRILTGIVQKVDIDAKKGKYENKQE